MSKYILCDWEINGYNDSDFVCMYYDTQTDTIGTYEYGTTRFAAPTTYGIAEGKTTIFVRVLNEATCEYEQDTEPLFVPTPAIVAFARRKLEAEIYKRLVEAEQRDVDQPEVNQLREGLELITVQDCRNQVYHMGPCVKCDGSGHWINPRNPADKRPCFSCDGTGKRATEKAKDTRGKLLYEKIPAGTKGKVIEWKSFGRFYANGHNRPNRENTTVFLKTPEGKVFRASLNKCKLARGYASDAELLAKANTLSYNYGWQGLASTKCAWLSRNIAAEVAGKIVR